MHNFMVVVVVAYSAVLGIFCAGVGCYSTIKWCNPESPYPEEAAEKTIPTINLTVRNSPSVLHRPLFANETFTVVPNEGVHLEFLCEASYPIHWVEIDGEDSEGYGAGSVTLWNDRVSSQGTIESLDKFLSYEVWTYQSTLGLKLVGKMCLGSTYSCQGVSNPCLQANAVTKTNKRKDTVFVRMFDEVFYAFNVTQLDQNETAGSSGSLDYGRRIINSTIKCPVIVNYDYSFDDAYPRWECKTSDKVRVTETSESSTCDSAAHCSIFMKQNRGSTECINHEKGCYYCAGVKGHTFQPGFITCKDSFKRLLLAVHYFYSVPQFDAQKPVLYFRWEDANPKSMLRLHSPPSEIYWNETISLRCEISRYYFSYGHRFALQYENDTIQFQDASDGVWNSFYNVNVMNTTLVLSDLSLKRIFCLAPIWNTTDWVNKSAEIVVRTDPIHPSFSNYSLSKLFSHNHTYQEVIFHYGEVNASFSCEGYGHPVPNANWTTPSLMNSSLFVITNISKSAKKLTFPFATYRIEGDYTCTIENYLGRATKTVKIFVRERYWTVILGFFLIIILSTVIFIIAMTLCWRKIKQQQTELRLLTQREVRTFMDGNIDAVQKCDYLDTADLIQSLPYNTKYEIPKERIHIDQSVVLGSGNFGQVLKGHVEILNHQNGKRSKDELRQKCYVLSTVEVAVKTGKEDMDVMHFKTLLSEVKIMAYIGKHSNVVSLIGACTKNIRRKEIFIAVEFCIHGSLESFLQINRKSFVNLVKADTILENISFQEVNENKIDARDPVAPLITTHHLIKWSREIANGMEYLGSKKIVHGDLAARNVFLTTEMIAKIGDFGLSRQLLEYSTYIKNPEYPLPWKHLAFEALQEMKFSVFSDIWAYGITIWEIFTLANKPYPGVIWSPEFLEQLFNGMRMHKPSYATTKIYSLMLDCWSIEPTSRPSFFTIKSVFESFMFELIKLDYFELCLKTEKQILSNDHNELTNVYHSSPRGASTSLSKKLHPNNAENSQSVETTEDTEGYLIPRFEI